MENSVLYSVKISFTEYGGRFLGKNTVSTVFSPYAQALHVAKAEEYRSGTEGGNFTPASHRFGQLAAVDKSPTYVCIDSFTSWEGLYTGVTGVQHSSESHYIINLYIFVHFETNPILSW